LMLSRAVWCCKILRLVPSISITVNGILPQLYDHQLIYLLGLSVEFQLKNHSICFVLFFSSRSCNCQTQRLLQRLVSFFRFLQKLIQKKLLWRISWDFQFLLRRYFDDTICINIKRNLNLRNSSWCWYTV
jgi:hypothetical protein